MADSIDWRKKALICDLDGTLIDSSSSILDALRRACDACRLTPVVPLEKNLIGPPLDEMLRLVTNRSNPEELSQLKSSFMNFYDSEDCISAQPFPGVEEMLSELKNLGCHLAIATNKRGIPTRRIIESKNWQKYFIKIETIDSGSSGKQTKAQMIKNILQILQKDLDALFLGDTMLDYLAANEAGIPFLLVDWGYQKIETDKLIRTTSSAREVINFLKSDLSSF